ncbi:hypothetical protein AZI86_15270 [Bdellovibrio bacteriovorus]|uniref:Hydrolase n=1 Tax=Bdellovibrio bacteriovorus TaxID=959 RepID=A0A150WHL9_BDEBC|nr:hypothetical protein [Bdellovibrio bacteriovorus]KYG63078.1 hypothetical protein AZI86_15270 [Bdellovibrio bacteriovorus]
MKTLVMFVILFSASRIAPATLARGIVVWNVGQGQWITMPEQNTCFHFDMGGEFFPWESLKKLCAHRANEVLLSHWDWDHIGALAQSKIIKTLPDICIRFAPRGPASPRKVKILKKFRSCSTEPLSISSWTPPLSKNSNDSSRVYLFKNILMPGDSTKKLEELWSKTPWVASAQVLVLGHHGSNTSTSEMLLNRLANLKISISSARWRRYSHPHPQTIARLKKFRTPLLRTEDWGHIWLE